MPESHLAEPQNLKELVSVLQKYNLLAQTNVFYTISLIPKQIIPWLINYTDTPHAPICFEAYTKADLSIGYAFKQPEKLHLQNLPFLKRNQLTYLQKFPHQMQLLPTGELQSVSKCLV